MLIFSFTVAADHGFGFKQQGFPKHNASTICVANTSIEFTKEAATYTSIRRIQFSAATIDYSLAPAAAYCCSILLATTSISATAYQQSIRTTTAVISLRKGSQELGRVLWERKRRTLLTLVTWK